METPQVQTIEYLVEVSSLDRDISLYPSPFKFQVPLKDNYRFVVKVELLQAEFYICDNKNTNISKKIYKLGDLDNRKINSRFKNLKNLYLTIDELKKGNYDSSNTVINEAFCSFKNFKIGQNNFYDDKMYTFPNTSYSLSAPLPGLNKMTLTIHPHWVKQPYPCFESIIQNFQFTKMYLHNIKYLSDKKEFCLQVLSKNNNLTNDEYKKKYTICKLEFEAKPPVKICQIPKNIINNYKDYVEAEKELYKTKINKYNHNKIQMDKVESRDRAWGRLNHSVEQKSIDENALYNLATKNNYKYMDLCKQTTFLFRITCMIPINRNNNLNARVKFM